MKMKQSERKLKLNLLIISEDFFSKFAVKHFFVWSQIFWSFDPLKWLFPQKWHVDVLEGIG